MTSLDHMLVLGGRRKCDVVISWPTSCEGPTTRLVNSSRARNFLPPPCALRDSLGLAIAEGLEELPTLHGRMKARSSLAVASGAAASVGVSLTILTSHLLFALAQFA